MIRSRDPAKNASRRPPENLDLVGFEVRRRLDDENMVPHRDAEKQRNPGFFRQVPISGCALDGSGDMT